jgi:hypothetical protein
MRRRFVLFKRGREALRRDLDVLYASLRENLEGESDLTRMAQVGRCAVLCCAVLCCAVCQPGWLQLCELPSALSWHVGSNA